jgi:hypothetical protein
LGDLHGAADHPDRTPPERRLRTTLGAEEVGHERKVAALDPGKEKGRPARGNNSPVDLRHLQPGAYNRLDNLEITVAIELLDEAPKILKSRIVHL